MTDETTSSKPQKTFSNTGVHSKWLGEITGNAEHADKYDSTNPGFLKKPQR